jgi:hypothetical protein
MFYDQFCTKHDTLLLSYKTIFLMKLEREMWVKKCRLEAYAHGRGKKKTSF